MKRQQHKKVYSEPTDNPDLYRIVMIMRKPKPKSKFRTIMWLAWHYQYSAQIYKKWK